MLEGVLKMCLCLVLIVSGWPPGQAKPYIKDLRWSAGQSETSIKENTRDDDNTTLLNTRLKNLKGQQKVKSMTIDDESNLADDEENQENDRENKRDDDRKVDTEVDTEVDRGNCTVSGLCDGTNSSEPVYSPEIVENEKFYDDYLDYSNNNDIETPVPEYEISEQEHMQGLYPSAEI